MSYILENDDMERESRDSEDLGTSKRINREFRTKNFKPSNITRIQFSFS